MKPRASYDEIIMRLRKARDFFEGGRRVLEPGYEVYSSSEQVPIYAQDDMGRYTRDVIRYASFPYPVSSYLHKDVTEAGFKFEDRCRRAYHIPVFRPVIDILTVGALKDEPDREFSPTFDTLVEDVDLKGTPMQAHMRGVLAKGLAFGRMHGLVNMTSSSTGRLLSAYDQIEGGVRPYVTPVSPLDIIDWEFDDRGELLWVVIQDVMRPDRKPLENECSTVPIYRVWTRSTWYIVTDGSEDKYEPLAAGDNPTGVVPLANFYTTPNRDWECESPLASLLDFDQALLNRISLIEKIERYAGFPLLLLPQDENGSTAPLILGPDKALSVPPNGKDPAYISPPDEHAQGQWNRSKEILEAVRNGVLALGDVGSVRQEVRSGAQIDASQTSRNNFLVAYAEECESYENEIYRLVGLWTGETPLEVEYEKEPDMEMVERSLGIAKPKAEPEREESDSGD